MTNVVTMPEHAVMERDTLNVPQQHSLDYVQGQLNPNLKTTYTR